MKSFFKTPDKKKQHLLAAGDMAGIVLSLLAGLFFQMLFLGSLGSFTAPLANLPTLPKVMALTNLFLLFVFLCLVFGFVYMTVYHVCGMYELAMVFNRRVVIRLGGAVLIGIAGMSVLLHGVSKTVFVAQAWALHFLTLYLLLLLWRYGFYKATCSEEPYRILVLDGDALSEKAAQVLSSNGHGRLFRFTNMTAREFFDAVGSEAHHDMIVFPFAGRLSQDQFVSLIKRKFNGVSICNSLAFYTNSTGSFPVYELDPQWFVNLSVSPTLTHRFQQRVKRVFDISFSLILMALSSAVFLFIAVLIKLTSRGPVFYVHERLGLHEKPFRVYKFRTMVENAEKDTGPVWARKNDPRITKVGRILRKTRLDELPQLINVLKGDMSVVGPRPIRKHFADQLTKQFPYYYLRFYVKPGLTGWAQVLGDYGDSVEGQLKKLEYELFYIHEYSLMLDLGIIFRTIRKVMTGEGQ